MSGPVRIQRSRAKGWRMPANTVYVGRPSRWGNPWAASHHNHEHHPDLPVIGPKDEAGSREEAVAKFRAYAASLDVTDLRGKNLACWCHRDWTCHADVLLELANPICRNCKDPIDDEHKTFCGMCREMGCDDPVGLQREPQP